MTTTTRDSYLTPSSERILEFRSRVDFDTDARLADELERRAKLFRETQIIPEAGRRPYEDCVELVQSYMRGDGGDWEKGRIARRIWKTGESLWHATWMIYGTRDGQGCQCGACEREKG